VKEMAVALAFAVLVIMARISTPPDYLMIADFDKPVTRNNFGGDFGPWYDPTDKTQYCKISFDSKNKRGRRGYSLRIEYDVDSPHPVQNGIWMKLNGLDFSRYDKLVFWVKGDKEKGYPRAFLVELKNNIGEVGRYYVTGITSRWQKIEIPLSKFVGISNFENMSELTITFIQKNHYNNRKGVLYIDDITCLGKKD